MGFRARNMINTIKIPANLFNILLLIILAYYKAINSNSILHAKKTLINKLNVTPKILHSPEIKVFLQFRFVQEILDFVESILLSIFKFNLGIYFSKMLFMYTRNDENLTPAERLTLFKARKSGLVGCIIQGYCHLPIRTFYIIYEGYLILNDSNITNTFSRNTVISITLLVITMYILISGLGTFHRSYMKIRWVNKLKNKNKKVELLLNKFELIKISNTSKHIPEDVLFMNSKTEMAYYTFSEFYRFAARFYMFIIEIGFIVIYRNMSTKFDIDEVLMRMANLSRNLLLFRNDWFSFMEYWASIDINNLNDEKQTIEYSFNECISALNLRLPSNKYDNINDYEIIQENANLMIKTEYNELVLPNSIETTDIQCSTKENTNKSLKLVHFTVSKNSKTLIVGPSGSGKSTILKSIAGNFKYSGSLMIDKVEVSNINRRSLLNNISYLCDKQYTFNNTVLFNILYGTNITESEAIFKLKKLGLFEYLDKLNYGLLTRISDKGKGLSNGQKQMVCIARCLLKEAEIYILDEPTRYLDMKSTELIYNIIRNMRNKTVIVGSSISAFQKYFDNIISI